MLTTKFHTPAIDDRMVTRATLLDVLESAAERKATLLSAPAGWGKTILLAQWATRQGGDCRYAWLSLDHADSDPAVFWSYVIGALRHAEPGLAPRALELLEMGADLAEAVLPTLLNELDMFEQPIVLILDDYHAVANPVVHEQMAFVLERMPANMHLVLATRSDPSLPLARLRVSRDLRELRIGELRLSEDEATLLLNGALDLGLTPDEIGMLHERTEGWAAGLYLVALSLSGRADKHTFIVEFTGNNRHIVDYLSTEVLDRQQPELRGFLVRTSVLPRLNGSLCDAVLDSADSGAILQRIEKDNLFLVPMDWSRHWYRYHQLFAELLRSELRRTEPDLVPVLHARAAEWFRVSGAVDDAVHHLAAAGDVAGSTELIAANWAREYNRGRLSTVSGWLDTLPEATVSSDPRLAVARAWMALDTGRVEDADAWIEAAETALADGHVGPGALHNELVVLRAVCCFKIGDIDVSLTLAGRAVGLDLSESYLGLSAAFCIYGSALYWSGHHADARVAYQRAVDLSDEVNNHLGRAYALGYLAVISAKQGLIDEAKRLVQLIIGDGRDMAEGDHFVSMMSSLATAMILDHGGETRAAADAVQKAVTLARRGGGVIEIVSALRTQSQILGRLGAAAAARASADEAATLLRTAADPAQARRQLAAVTRGFPEQSPEQGAGPVLHEALSQKEFEVLELMTTRLSRREIGERLFVSLNTVKSHQRALYRKLGVSGRAEALSRARQLGVL